MELQKKRVNPCVSYNYSLCVASKRKTKQLQSYVEPLIIEHEGATGAFLDKGM